LDTTVQSIFFGLLLQWFMMKVRKSILSPPSAW
jgi:hypothetical protein